MATYTPRLSSTSVGASIAPGGLAPLYDRQYITLHNLLEKEMRNRVESEKMIRDDMTQMQEGMARICNQIQEVAADLKGNLPRLFQETKEIRRDTQQLTMAYNHSVSELQRLNDLGLRNKSDSDARSASNEQKIFENAAQDRAEKQEMSNKLCTKQVVQDLADKVGCMDMEAHAKFLERRQEHEEAVAKIQDLEKKVQQALDEFLRGINKCDYLYTQCNNANIEFKRASENVTESHRDMIDTIVFPRIERCEGLLNQEMCERVDCLKKIAHELVHSKEQTDKVKDQVDRLSVDLSASQAVIGDTNSLDGSRQSTIATTFSPVSLPAASMQPLLQLPANMTPAALQSPRFQNQSVMIGGKVYPPGTRILQPFSLPGAMGQQK